MTRLRILGVEPLPTQRPDHQYTLATTPTLTRGSAPRPKFLLHV